ncbi:hypothetical protein PMZ80_001608 [Knufia obscura]|uniref:Uncharacterized protein n=1 Tax=Knufia obscura TaxID=1635080 RepID=A0ABR0S3N2_9EURO|nr:hypothetical protein PMZ80_001608 [Knufia obscura]
MATHHPYNLRNRVNSPATSRTPGNTPNSKLLLNSVYKPQQSPVTLQLDHVIGTTTKNAGGLSACPESNTFAYCAGSVAVLAQVTGHNTVSRRYFRARPAATAVNPSTSFYSTPTSTPSRKRSAFATPKKEQENITPNRTLPEDENAKTWSARERIKSVKCVSLSPNGKFLAVGETGYNPRVLLYATAKDASTETPLAIISDHTWGVKCAAFSPDSSFLATLGEINDGFLFIWSVNSKTGAVKLCATNKCTTNICHMTWCGLRPITAGTRHVKIWQLPGHEQASPSKRSRLRYPIDPSSSAGPTPLAGRNCLLGDLVDVTFTCAVAITEHDVLICTDGGTLCRVDISRTPAHIEPVRHETCPVGAMGFREGPRRLVWAGGGGEMQETSVDVLLGHKEPPMAPAGSSAAFTELGSRVPKRSALRQSLGLSQLSQRGTIAVSCLTKHTVCIDTESNLVLSSTDAEEPSTSQRPLSAHNGPVAGVQPLDPAVSLGAFFTWSKNGEVRFWSNDAQLLRVEQIELDEGSDVEDAACNELKVLRHSQRGVFVSGDRFGVLKLIKCEKWELLHTARAHSAEVNDTCFDNASEFVATCSRDRMVQVFRLQDTNLDLLQTTDDHIAAVNQLTFSHDGGVLLSCSSDRTIVVREKVTRDHGRETLIAFLQTRIITIKASPLSMCLVPGKDDLLYVSTLDRHVTKIDFTTGTTLESFKVTETDSDDHAVLNSIRVAANLELGKLRDILVGCSSTDKSVRVYDLQKQHLISKENAHTEGISDIALLGDSTGQHVASTKSFVSTGLDSTIMLWSVVPDAQIALTPAVELTQDQATGNHDSDVTPAKASPATLPPLRKVLTKLDIANFVKDAPPRSPSRRDPSPARPGLKRKGSRLALASSAIEEADENTSPALRRRASADERGKLERRSPSPPAYATRRQKKPPARGEVSKDFFTRQSEWLSKSPEPQETPTAKQEIKANKARLRRPPSVPSDLRARAKAQERRMSTVGAPSEFSSVNMASEQTSRMLRTYKKKLETADVDLDLDEIERELESTLQVVRQKKLVKQASAGTRKSSTPRLKRVTSTSTFSPTPSTLSPIERKVGTTSSAGSEANSPVSGSTFSDSTQKAQPQQRVGNDNVGLGVDGLSIKLERTNLAGV